MKCAIALVSLCVMFSWTGTIHAATPDAYVCRLVESTVESQARDISSALNSMGCDTEKPFTVNLYYISKYAMVCCVRELPGGVPREDQKK